jgi:hypothetical protein
VLPFLDRVGEVPENPGFWIPNPSFGLGFFKLDLSGDLVTDEEPTVDPFVDPIVVEVVFMEAMLPLDAVGTYGLPLASVTETLLPEIVEHSNSTHGDFLK